MGLGLIVTLGARGFFCFVQLVITAANSEQ